MMTLICGCELNEKLKEDPFCTFDWNYIETVGVLLKVLANK